MRNVGGVAYEKAKSFALRTVKLYRFLCSKKNEYILSKQLLRSGTSIGANISEAEYAVSKRDFLSKMYIALKECAETKYWLELLYKSEYLTKIQYESIDKDCQELLTIISSITKTVRERLDKV